MKNIFFYFLLIVGFFSFGQTEESVDYVSIDKKDTIYSVDNAHVCYYVDKSKSIDFESVLKQKFQNIFISPKNSDAFFWSRFKISSSIKTKYFVFFLRESDESDIYIPLKNGYKRYRLGYYTRNKKIRYNVNEKTYLVIPFDSIDFSKKLYYNKKILTSIGKNSIKVLPEILLTDNLKIVDGFLREDSLTDIVTNYTIIFLFSFILFLSSFFITKDVNYLNYSFYLFFIVILFGIRIPLIFNFFNSIHPRIYYYLDDLSQIISSGFYYYFIIVFLDFENRFKRLYHFSKGLLFSFVIFGIILIILNLLFPYSIFRFTIFSIYRIVFTLISLGIFIYLMRQKLDLTSKIVLFGSFLLITGNFLTLIFNDFTIFLNTAIAEIFLFSGIISHKHKIETKKRIENKLALEITKNERESLQILDELKTKFFSNVSHEFRTPLTLILGPAQQMLKKKELDVDDRKNLELIQRNSTRLLTLVNQLLDISKVESGKAIMCISKNRIIPFVETLIDSFKYLAQQKELKFKVISTDTSEETWFDKDIVEKIVVNLLSNAIKYTPKKGEVVCEIAVEDTQFHFQTKNTGKQLSAKEIEKIFDRFYQIDKHQEGTGIGLSLVKEIVSLHKGTIKVASTAKWTTFNVVLPVAKTVFNKDVIEEVLSETPQEKSIDEPIAVIDNTTIDIEDTSILLIVEDNADVRTYVKSIFKDTYTVVEAANGQEGIDQAIKYIPDIIISDIMMPVKDGIKLCNTLKTDERTSHIPIVLLTAKVGDDNEIKGVKTGADDYITKPFNEELLKLKVERLISVRKKLQERYSQEVVLTPTDISVNSTDELFLNNLQHIIDNNFVETTFSIDDFCKSTNMSRMQLHRKIKAMFGLTTTEFIRLQRLKMAAKLLQQSDVNVSQVGYSVGFNNPAYFSKCFKQVFGVTPTKYSKSHK